MPVIPALRRLRQENFKLKASLSCIARYCLREKKKSLHDFLKEAAV
jgi:hypothetical protein